MYRLQLCKSPDPALDVAANRPEIMSADIAEMDCKVRGFCTANSADNVIGEFKRETFADFAGHGRLMLHFSKNRPPNPGEMQYPRILQAISADIAISA